jgi:hypothetical protein
LRAPTFALQTVVKQLIFVGLILSICYDVFVVNVPLFVDGTIVNSQNAMPDCVKAAVALGDNTFSNALKVVRRMARGCEKTFARFPKLNAALTREMFDTNKSQLNLPDATIAKASSMVELLSLLEHFANLAQFKVKRQNVDDWSKIANALKRFSCKENITKLIEVAENFRNIFKLYRIEFDPMMFGTFLSYSFKRAI